jgi:hypothetical protein
MIPEATVPAASGPEDYAGFSIVHGGPMMRLMARLGIENPPRRAIGYILVTWVPLLVLSAASSLSGGHELRVFLSDLPALVRFLVAAPILVLAETRIHRFTFQTARQFAAAGLVRPAERERYRAALNEVARGRESRLAEAVIVVLAYVAAWIWFRNELRTGEAGWHAREDSTGLHFLPAGIWYVFASIPFYQFLIFRWIYRMLLWIRFLWRMSRLDLDLYPTHPDHAAGLGFIAAAQSSFSPIVFATAAVTSAILGEQILAHATTLESVQWVVLALVVVIYPLLLLGPLVVFFPLLARVRRAAELNGGALATRYVRLFHEKWGPDRGPDSELLGTPDIQSLSDLQNSLSATQRMRLVPVTRNSAKALLLAGALPYVPLILTKFPLQTVLKMLLRVAG